MKKYFRPRAVVLLSGGMDSLVSLSMAIQNNYHIFALHLNYKQKTEIRELKAYHDICDYYGIKDRLVVDISYLYHIGGSSLTDRSIEVSKSNLNSKEVPTSYVPFRNANILSISVSWAEVVKAKKIIVGAVEEDASSYPDCRTDFYEAFGKVIEVGTASKEKIKIETPVINMKKEVIVKTGLALGAPFKLTWSCYQSEDKACGVCDSCGFRLRGFQNAGIEDPIPYQTY